MDPFLLEALKLTALPLAVAGGGLVLGSRLAPERRPFVLALTVTGAFVAVLAAVAGWSALPPRQALDLLPWLALGGPLLALAAGRRGAVLGLTALLAAGSAWWLLSRWKALEPALAWQAGTAAGLLLLWWPVAAGSVRATAASGVLALSTGGAAGLAMLNHSAKLASVSGGLAVALGLIAVASLLRPCKHAARGAVLAGAVPLGLLLVYQQHGLSVAPLELGLLVLAPLSLHLGRLPAARAWDERQAMVRHGLLALVPVLAALAVAWQRYAAEAEANPYY